MPIKLLKTGSKAPDIKSKDQDGNPFELKSLRGSKVVLYFYPKDDTSGCTAEACNLRDNYHDLLKKGVKVIGVSKDDEASHRKFIEKYSLPFPLLADIGLGVVKEYGVWGDKQNYGRTYKGIHRVTYLINEKGVIDHVISKVKTGEHAEQIMELWGM